jgi:NAD+ kinase
MRIAIFGRTFSESRNAPVKELYQSLLELGAQLVIYEPFYQQTRNLFSKEVKVETFNSAKAPVNCRLMITIGGDGTLLEAITHVRNSGIPLMGINTGRLGFLTAFSKDEIPQAIALIGKNKLFVEDRTLLELITEPNPFATFPYALNEATLHKKDSSSMVTLQVKRNGDMLNHYWADGLIVSTATGSTGYSLSCGGPIMLPSSRNFILTPIAPHNLNVRPLVISDEDLLTIKSEVRGKEIMVSLDSRSAPIAANQELEIRRAPFSIKLVRRDGFDFLDTIREKLMWGNDKRN